MNPYYLELEKKYMQYALFNKNNEIIGFVENTPIEAKQAAKEHILMSKKFDDPSNYKFWDDKLDLLGL